MTTTTATTAMNLLNKILLKQDGMVILPLEEYNRLKQQAVPTYYLKGKAAQDLDQLVTTSMQDYRQGKTKKITSLADLD
ncbi:MAG: hypothetical protein WCW27_06680 [Patescibacteria group bacterium]|jgi:hypothetical protein